MHHELNASPPFSQKLVAWWKNANSHSKRNVALPFPRERHVYDIKTAASVIWGAAETRTARIDRVQHKFLMWLLSHTSSGYAPSLSYENLLHHFRLPSLKSRRMQHDVIFIPNIFRLKIDSADLLASFTLHIPTRSTRAY